MSPIKHVAVPAGLAAALFGGAPLHAQQSLSAMPSSGTLVMRPGQTLPDAVRMQAVQSRAAGLHAAWLAGGHTATAAAYTAPTLLSGKVPTQTLRIGNPFSLPKLSFGFDAGTVGLNFAAFTFTSQSGTQAIQPYFAPGPFTASGSITFTFPATLPPYSQSGQWTLTGATIIDNAGNTTNYTAAQLAPIFTANTLTVVDTGPIDDTPPTVTGATLSATTISLSSILPQLKTTFTAADSGSGLYQALLFLAPPGATYEEAGVSPLRLPINAGKVPTYFDFNQYSATGTYTIVRYDVCDVAGNCVTDSSAADIQAMFGTTSITVTP